MSSEMSLGTANKTVKSAVVRASASAETEEKGESLKDRLLKKKVKLSDNSRVVLEKRYLRKDDNGTVTETPEEMFFRIAENIASAEKKFSTDASTDIWTEKFYNTMTDLDFLPNSPTLMNAGRELQQLSACFVLPVGDSMDEIFESVKNTALIHKSGGGTGLLLFAHPPQERHGEIHQGHLERAAVVHARVRHRHRNREAGRHAARRQHGHPQLHPSGDHGFHRDEGTGRRACPISTSPSASPRSSWRRSSATANTTLRTRAAASRWASSRPPQVFKRIVELSWKNGEPGIVFLDKINADNPTPQLGEIESTNPCGEQPLLPYESCNLGSINLAHMVTETNGKKEINYLKLGNTIRTAVRFLDNVIEVNSYPLPQIDKMTKGNRKIGLGVMGFADLLIELGIPYNSPAAANMAEQVMKFISEEGRRVSAFLAQERGVFPNFKGSIYDREGGLKVRNATVTTIAPTGTISMIAGASSGIEPLFAIVYEKNVLDGQHLLEVHPEFKRVAQDEGFYSDELMKMVAFSGSLDKIYGIPKRIRDIFVTAHDIEPRWHISIQAAFQKYTDNAVSKTVNFKHEATVEGRRRGFSLRIRTRVQGRHRVPRRHAQEPGDNLRNVGKERRGPDRRLGGRPGFHPPAPAPGGHARPHLQDQNRMRQPVCECQRRRRRPVRDLHPDGKIGRLPRVQLRGGFAAHLAGPARRR